jgi:hypothetical protein
MSDTKPPRQHDEALPGLGDVAATTTNAGYLQRHVAAAIVAAELDDRDKGMGALAEACAWAVDLAHYRRDPYAVAAAARELRETLVRLRMDPASRLGNDAGQVETWLESLQAD